jgi:hypothetical protein
VNTNYLHYSNFKPTDHINNEAQALGHNDLHYLAVQHHSHTADSLCRHDQTTFDATPVA